MHGVNGMSYQAERREITRLGCGDLTLTETFAGNRRQAGSSQLGLGPPLESSQHPLCSLPSIFCGVLTDRIIVSSFAPSQYFPRSINYSRFRLQLLISLLPIRGSKLGGSCYYNHTSYASTDTDLRALPSKHFLVIYLYCSLNRSRRLILISCPSLPNSHYNHEQKCSSKKCSSCYSNHVPA